MMRGHYGRQDQSALGCAVCLEQWGRRPGETSDRILFWTHLSGGRPQDFVRHDIPSSARQIVAAVLAAGRDVHPEFQAMGWANCRICGRRLGTRDLGELGLVWPELAEHYVLEHGVWTPGCSELLSRIVTVLGQSLTAPVLEDAVVGTDTGDDLGESEGRILFWSRTPGGRPQDFIRRDIPPLARQRVAAILSSGREVYCYKGSADCRICGRSLGTRDLGNFGLVWPELAEHYVLEHGVWTPGCSELLARVTT